METDLLSIVNSLFLPAVLALPRHWQWGQCCSCPRWNPSGNGSAWTGGRGCVLGACLPAQSQLAPGMTGTCWCTSPLSPSSLQTGASDQLWDWATFCFCHWMWKICEQLPFVVMQVTIFLTYDIEQKICLEQCYMWVFKFKGDTFTRTVKWESIKQISTTLLNSFNQAQTRQHPCIETWHMKKLWIQHWCL